MSSLRFPALTRRRFLTTTAAVATAGAMATLARPLSSLASPVKEVRLRAAPDRVQLVPGPYEPTPAWCYNATVPGPEIRVRQGDRLRVTVENDLDEATTVHWHGVRVPNAMDGVPDLTQTPIAPGMTFVYEFDAADAGTFWYHPHQRSFEQVGRGLYGPLIVEEEDPIRVDRELTWVLDDWRLTETAAISNDFGSLPDKAHGGRIGNVVTINGRVPETFAVARGERVRLRLINAANARIFALDFMDHAPTIIALDAQPVTPHTPENDLVILGPAMRADVILDFNGEPGDQTSIVDRFYRGGEYTLVDIAYSIPPLRERAPDWPIDLKPNPLAEPDIASARRHDILFTGGMMGGMVARDMGMPGGVPGGMMGGMMGGGMMNSGAVWFVNGVAAEGHVLDPILTLGRDGTHVISMTNATAFAHPIHLHGHSFRVVARDGKPTRHREWLDTVLMAPRERVDIALVADNPGDWMFHCHILEHQASGMSAVIRVG